MFGAQIPRRHSSFHNKHVNPHMLCLIMASCTSPRAIGTISELAQILFILNVPSASGQAGALQAVEPFQQLQRTGAVWQRSDTSMEQGTESLHPSLSPWLPLSRRLLGRSANLSNCWFLLVAPASPPPLIRSMLLQATAFIKSGNQSWYSWKIISLSFFWLILFQTARFVTQFLMQTHKHTMSVQWRWWQKCRDKDGDCWWFNDSIITDHSKDRTKALLFNI